MKQNQAMAKEIVHQGYGFISTHLKDNMKYAMLFAAVEGKKPEAFLKEMGWHFEKKEITMLAA